MTDSAAPARDPHQAGVIDLLGMLAYGALRGFERLAEDASRAPDLTAEVAMVRLAATQSDHYRGLERQLVTLGREPVAAMLPFRAAIDGYHTHTAPRTWLEALIKAHVGGGLAADFAREVARCCDPGIRRLVEQVTDQDELTAFIPPVVRRSLTAQPSLAGALALWGRRLVGEAMSQAQRVSTDRPELADLIAGLPGDPDRDPARVAEVFHRLAQRHGERIATLGITA